MKISEYISKDVNALSLNNTIEDAKLLFNALTYTHLPIVENNTLVGLILESDTRTIEDNDKKLSEIEYLFVDFYTSNTDNWMEILKLFAANETNLLPVLSEDRKYIGYYELIDVLHFFNDTPLLSNDGFFLVIEKEETQYSFSEIAQIIESTNAKLIGIFVSGHKNNFVRINQQIDLSNINRLSSFNLIIC